MTTSVKDNIPKQKLSTHVDEYTTNGGETTELSRWLRQRRLEVGLTATEISKRLGYHESWWGLHEVAHGSAKYNKLTGKRGPFVPTIKTIQGVAPLLKINETALAKICGRTLGEPTGFNALEIKMLRAKVDELESRIVDMVSSHHEDRYDELVNALRVIAKHIKHEEDS